MFFDHRDKPAERRRSATVVESVEELIGRPVRQPTAVEVPGPPSARPGEAPPVFRPSLRPPMALLCAYDDGLETGETVRVRVPSLVIGRETGDLVIPHDAGMSGRHAEIVRRPVGGRYRWSLRDLDSTNGTFVRTARAALVDGQEMFVGGSRFRFEFREGSSTPRLVEIGAPGGGAAFSIEGPEAWIGRDRGTCSIVLDRPGVGPRHAAIRARRPGRWMVEKGDSGDGVWLRIEEVDLGRGGQFQCGEQRFLFRVL